MKIRIAFASFTEAVMTIGGHPYIQVFITTNVICFISGSGPVGIPTVVNTFGQSWIAAGVNPDE